MINVDVEPLIKLYEWMQNRHNMIKKMSELPQKNNLISSEYWDRIETAFFSALMQGDLPRCQEIAHKSSENMKDFCVEVMQPALYKVGHLWEKNTISIIHEQHATAIASKVLTSLCSHSPIFPNKGKGSAVITTAPGELHELGVWMVAELLERDGWQVYCLTDHYEIETLLTRLAGISPCLLGISVSTFFSIESARELVDRVKKVDALRDTKILVGGSLFRKHATLWKGTGADDYAVDARAAAEKASKLCQDIHKETPNQIKKTK